MAKKPPAKKPPKEDKNKLQPKEELFCQYYVNNSELFGNGVLSYAEAYGYKLNEMSDEPECNEDGEVIGKSEKDKAYNVCGVEGFNLLKKPKIERRVNELLDELLEHEVVDRELLKVIKQSSNLRAKVAAISEYNKVRGRITEKHKHKFEDVSDEKLAERIAKRIAGIIGDDGGTGSED